MALIGRHFGLSEARGGSISCSADGVFVGEVPLLERSYCRNDFQQWQPRLTDDLNRDLELWTSGQMGKDYNRGLGRTVSECIMGRVSQDCGGNGVDT
jgi:hypothetical protein